MNADPVLTSGGSVRVVVENTPPTGLGYRSRIIRTFVDGAEVSRVEVVGDAPGALPKLSTVLAGTRAVPSRSRR